MRSVVIGASGQVGTAVAAVAAERGEVRGTAFRHPAPGLTPLDMTDGEAVARFLDEAEPDVVWIPAAATDVDRCERDPEWGYTVNVLGPRRVAEAAELRGLKVVFFSTDYVFDGRHGPYSEDDPPRPLMAYGRQKLEAERWLLDHCTRLLIVRTAWIYSEEARPRNFVYRVLEQLASGQPVPAAIDQLNTPTYASDLVRRALDLLERGTQGVVHLAGRDRMSRYALTRTIAGLAGYDPGPVRPVRLAALQLPAPRPLDGGLVSVRAEPSPHTAQQDLATAVGRLLRRPEAGA
ncbi:MAG: SDR family oxidoreductase [Firmicutes bacterium]|nr:SDR family oxidoreductase [Bacillota bacterium]